MMMPWDGHNSFSRLIILGHILVIHCEYAYDINTSMNRNGNVNMYGCVVVGANGFASFTRLLYQC